MKKELAYFCFYVCFIKNCGKRWEKPLDFFRGKTYLSEKSYSPKKGVVIVQDFEKSVHMQGQPITKTGKSTKILVTA